MEQFFKKYNIIFLVMILVLGGFLRTYRLKTIPAGLLSEEARNGRLAANLLEAQSKTASREILDSLSGYSDKLLVPAQSAAIKLLGRRPFGLRLTSAIFGLLAILGMYHLSKLFSKKESVALLSSFFMAISFWHIAYSRIGAKYVMATLLVTWILWLMIITIRSLTQKIMPRRFTDEIWRISLFIILISWLPLEYFSKSFRIGAIPQLPRHLTAIIPSIIIAAYVIVFLAVKINYWLNAQITKYPQFTEQISRIKKELVVLFGVFLITVISNTYVKYFIKWQFDSGVSSTFNIGLTELSGYINALPTETKKKVILNAGSDKYADCVSSDCIDMKGSKNIAPSEIVMFLTDTFSADKRKEKNIDYVIMNNLDTELENIKKEKSETLIFLLSPDVKLRKTISDTLLHVYTYEDRGIIIQHKFPPPEMI